jgi:D-alanyl-D-alanine dipeptidase
MSKLNESFSIINDIDSNIICQIDYATPNNFTGNIVKGYEEPLAILSNEAIEALTKAQSRFQLDGYTIIIYDAYRPMKAVKYFLNEWSITSDIKELKEKYYPDFSKLELFEEGYLSKRSSHCRGSTLDMGLIDIKNKKPMNFGTIFDFFGELSHTQNTMINKEHQDNRKYLCETMQQYGFRNYHKEWWHFTLDKEKNIDIYYDFDVKWNFYE